MIARRREKKNEKNVARPQKKQFFFPPRLESLTNEDGRRRFSIFLLQDNILLPLEDTAPPKRNGPTVKSDIHWRREALNNLWL